MLLVQFSFPKADKMKCFLMFESVEFFFRCYCRRWVRRGLCRTSGARAVNVADLAGSVVAVASCCCRCSTHKTKNSHTLGFLLDSFSQLSQFWFSDIRITNGGMCLMRKALLIKLGQKWFEPNLTRSGSLIDVKDNDNDDATCSSVGRSRCFACLLGGRWKNQQSCSLKQSQKMIAPRV